ncbi:MAG: hypothetical protein Hens3KO_07010 [Henriciella sp.]
MGTIMLGGVGNSVNSMIEKFFGEDEARASRFFWAVFGAICLLGTVLRFWNLSSAPIWMDEAVTLAMAELSISTILFSMVDNHPPLTFAIQHYWQMLFPDPAYARVPAAFAGSLSVAIIMLAARDLFSPRAALFAGLFFAAATGHIYYSQDARMYSYLILGLILAAWGAAGHVRLHLCSKRAYLALYVIGGAIAIYAHMLGLVVMALIGFSSLAAGLLTHGSKPFLQDWLFRNIVLFVLTLLWLAQIPAAMGTFPGLAGSNALLDIQWFYRNITGFPGLGSVSILFEAIFYMAAGLSILLAWKAKRRGIAVMLASLIIVFPIIIIILEMRQPIYANKVLLPAVIGVTLGAAYTLSRLQTKWLGSLLAGIIGLAAFTSSATELRHHVKMEDYPAGFAYADANGFDQAPVLTCLHFSTAAVWEARPSAYILQYRKGGLLHYQGREYWQAASRSMSWLRAASAEQIDEELGGGWLIEGGLPAALEDASQVAFMRSNCPGGQEQDILTKLSDLGFELVSETDLKGPAADFQILDTPLSKVSLYARP